MAGLAGTELSCTYALYYQSILARQSKLAYSLTLREIARQSYSYTYTKITYPILNNYTIHSYFDVDFDWTTSLGLTENDR